MSQKRKSGLQRGLSEIVERQTAPREDKSKLSRDLVGKFADARDTLPAPATPATQGTNSTQRTQGTRGKLSAPKTVPFPGAAEQPVSPARDFMKVANSIGREVVPAGVFSGKGKQIYDYLYAKTRGSITPARSAQLTRREIMRGAHIGSDKTLRENLLRLRRVGLVTWDGNENIGAHAGNLYTVFLPEEVRTTSATQGTQGTEGSPGLFLPLVPTVESTLGTQGLSVEGSIGSGDPKTLFKTKEENTDDEPTAFAELRQAERELTGKNSSSGNWSELDKVLAAELRIAAGRTTVSSVPAFLAEHLRRRLWKLDKKQAQAEGRELPDQVAAAESSKPRPDCPDCGGSGWWYPDGPERGVMKCAHKNALQTREDVPLPV
jgi:hypothetical protein